MPEGLSADPIKRQKIMDHPTQSNRRQLWGFMGIVNYLSKFLPNLASIATPLAEIQGEGKPGTWMETHNTAFQNIQQMCNSEQLLKPWDITSKDPVYLVCDAGDLGLGSSIGEGTLDSIRPARFHSRKLNPAQLNYATYDKELLAIHDSLHFFEPKLLLLEQFTILTDHKPLLNFMDNTHDSQGRSRIANYMQRFNAKIEFTAGKENLIADTLYRVHKYPRRPTSEKDFIPQYINPTPVYYTGNKLLFSDTYNSILITSTTSTATTMDSCGSINFKHVDCDYNKCRGREISLGHHSSCPFMDEDDQQDEGEATDGYEMVPLEPDSSTESLSNIDPYILEGYVPTHFDPPAVSNPSLNKAEETIEAANPNYPVEIQNTAKYDQKHCNLHWTASFDNNCFTQNKYYTRTRTIHNTTCSICGSKDHKCLRCENKAEIIKPWKMYAC